MHSVPLEPGENADDAYFFEGMVVSRIFVYDFSD